MLKQLGNRLQPTKPLVDANALRKLMFEVGTLTKVSPIAKAKKPSFEMEASFGENRTKKSCGQFVRNYNIDELLNKQVFALTNLAPVRIAGIKSEYLTLGFADEQQDGQAIGISPFQRVSNGTRIVMSFPGENSQKDETKSEEASYVDFEAIEVKSGTIVEITNNASHSFACVDMGSDSHTMAYIPGKILEDNLKSYIGIQVPVIMNIDLHFSPDDEYFEYKSMLMVVPMDNMRVDLLKIDKPVKNGLNMF